VFNGKDGKDAYVAYNGVVYNVTGDQWENRIHHGLTAGHDITTDINNCTKHLPLASDYFQKVWERKNYSQVGTYIG
jgi:predicted heme/steroid binding protein